MFGLDMIARDSMNTNSVNRSWFILLFSLASSYPDALHFLYTNTVLDNYPRANQIYNMHSFRRGNMTLYQKHKLYRRSKSRHLFKLAYFQSEFEVTQTVGHLRLVMIFEFAVISHILF